MVRPSIKGILAALTLVAVASCALVSVAPGAPVPQLVASGQCSSSPPGYANWVVPAGTRALLVRVTQGGSDAYYGDAVNLFAGSQSDILWGAAIADTSVLTTPLGVDISCTTDSASTFPFSVESYQIPWAPVEFTGQGTGICTEVEVNQSIEGDPDVSCPYQGEVGAYMAGPAVYKVTLTVYSGTAAVVNWLLDDFSSVTPPARIVTGTITDTIQVLGNDFATVALTALPGPTVSWAVTYTRLPFPNRPAPRNARIWVTDHRWLKYSWGAQLKLVKTFLRAHRSCDLRHATEYAPTAKGFWRGLDEYVEGDAYPLTPYSMNNVGDEALELCGLTS